MAIFTLKSGGLQSLAISHAVHVLSTFDGTINGKETEQLNVPMSLEDYQLLEELLFGSPQQRLSMDDPAPSALLYQLGKHLRDSPLKLSYDPIRQRLLIMFSTELRSSFSQGLGAAIRESLASKLTDLTNDNTLASTLRDEVQRTLDMLTISYDCAIINPSTGTREIIPAVILLADDKCDVDKPLLMLVVDFSSNPDDHYAAHLLDMYPNAAIIRADIPYRDREVRTAAYRAGNTASLYTCFYDIIIRSSNSASTSTMYNVEGSSSSSLPDKLHFLVRNRPLLQQPDDGDKKPIGIPLAIFFPELTWRVALAHPAAGAAGVLSMQLQHAILQRILRIAAVRQKNMDMLRSKSTENKPSPSALPLSGFGIPFFRGLHTLTFSSNSAAVDSRSCTCNAADKGRAAGFVMPRRHGSDVTNLRGLVGFGWRLARRFRR
ncbi:hypothetical protein VMCG_03905 [Cytospora schulzeri]|uniref:Uncharacterized protein n=1 Tax=Cytospora schulzeri TaxID=448051 RepID=A0A423WUX7_9PEZI|nr:hypothetical protein VMCG_03905 [Valsa malicola]